MARTQLNNYFMIKILGGLDFEFQIDAKNNVVASCVLSRGQNAIDNTPSTPLKRPREFTTCDRLVGSRRNFGHHQFWFL
jgi:hypothetical protein